MNTLTTLLNYDEKTGRFHWKESRGSVKKGAIAGGVCGGGYRVIRVNRKHYYEHRLAWLFVNGEIPTGQIDHVNGNKTDNMIRNLRECSAAENQRNVRRTWGKSKYFGVGFHKKSKKWVARIRDGEKQLHLGLFENEEDAAKKYNEYAKKIHGSFAVLNFE